MFVLHVKIKMRSQEVVSAERVFDEIFKPAISAQPGFEGVQFLRPLDGEEYVLSIAFENRSRQQQWVATDLHTTVWGEMNKHFSEFSVKYYTAV